MSDDIPPLIPDTPPPMTKLDWEDDEDFFDFPHLALEIPSESSLSPDSGWNPINELPLPYDGDIVQKPPIDSIESRTNDSSSDWPPDIKYNDRSLPEQDSSLQKHDLSIWKDNENIIPWENNNKLTSDNSDSDSVCELDCKTQIKPSASSENVIESNKKKNDDDLSVIIEQYTCDLENVKNNITSKQYLPNLETQLNSTEIIEITDINDIGPEKLSIKETLVNGHLECIDIKEFSSNKTNCVQNVILENVSNDVNHTDSNISSNLYEVCKNDLSINNNNNIIIKNDLEEDCDSFCDFETDIPNSLNEPLPNRTTQVNIESPEHFQFVKQHLTSDNDKILQNVDKSVEEKIEQSIDLTYQNDSTFQNQQYIDNQSDSEFDEFCDFHTFSAPTMENKSPYSNDDFSDFKTSLPDNSKTLEFKHSEIDHVQTIITHDINDSLTSKYDNQGNIHKNDVNIDNNDDNFCDFESGFTKSNFHVNNKIVNPKQNNEILNSESQVQFNYKEFCKDVFQGNYELCEEVDLQSLDNELNDTQIWKSLKDIESSPALNYNWSKSEANNVFLSSLSIDSRNILYGASWNPKVPRFAANMSNNPLEPLKASNNDTIDTKITQSFSIGPSQETVPDPEFDWKSSGLINPLDFQPQTWKTTEAIKEEESFVQTNLDSGDIFNDFLNASLPSSSDNNFMETTESSSAPVPTVSLEAQRILDTLPDFDVLQKPYLVILKKENNLFLT